MSHICSSFIFSIINDNPTSNPLAVAPSLKFRNVQMQVLIEYYYVTLFLF